MPELPVSEVLPGLLRALETSRSAVLVAPPGAGKTTLVPLALLGPLPSHADIRSTKHNLTGQFGLDPKLTDEREVCVFCHFPVVATDIQRSPSSQTVAEPPLWQQTVPQDHAYRLYDDLGRAGSGGPADAPESIRRSRCCRRGA